VIVVGAGLGGLAAAIGARLAGHKVVVYEQAPRLRESGAGIGLMPNGVLALDELGVGEQVRSMAMAAPGAVGLRDRRGRLLLATDQQAVAQQVGAPVVVVERQWLHRLLSNALPKGTVVTGVEVRAVHTDGRVETTSGDLTADLVVAADGVGSTARAQLFPHHPGLIGIGELAVRAIVARPAEFVAGPTRLDAERPQGRNARSVGLDAELPAGELLDHRTGRRFGCMPTADGQVYWYASLHGEPTGDPRDWLFAAYADWHPAVPALIKAAGPDSVRVDELVRLVEPLPSLVAGRVALLGDAAHAMTPDLGQGGCQAFEDAAVLRRELSAVKAGPSDAETDLSDVEAGDLVKALHRYDAARCPRTAAMLRASTQMNRILRLTGPAGRLRDLALRSVPGRLATRTLIRQFRMSGLTQTFDRTSGRAHYPHTGTVIREVTE
jgi:2-polyprenyl-6-methoxyphenol hydroxylase-like FAD-dependent oxidoreductase